MRFLATLGLVLVSLGLTSASVNHRFTQLENNTPGTGNLIADTVIESEDLHRKEPNEIPLGENESKSNTQVSHSSGKAHGERMLTLRLQRGFECSEEELIRYVDGQKDLDKKGYLKCYKHLRLLLNQIKREFMDQMEAEQKNLYESFLVTKGPMKPFGMYFMKKVDLFMKEAESFISNYSVDKKNPCTNLEDFNTVKTIVLDYNNLVNQLKKSNPGKVFEGYATYDAINAFTSYNIDIESLEVFIRFLNDYKSFYNRFDEEISSKWCLENEAEILRCEERKGLLNLYKVCEENAIGFDPKLLFFEGTFPKQQILTQVCEFLKGGLIFESDKKLIWFFNEVSDYATKRKKYAQARADASLISETENACMLVLSLKRNHKKHIKTPRISRKDDFLQRSVNPVYEYISLEQNAKSFLSKIEIQILKNAKKEFHDFEGPHGKLIGAFVSSRGPSGKYEGITTLFEMYFQTMDTIINHPLTYFRRIDQLKNDLKVIEPIRNSFIEFNVLVKQLKCKTGKLYSGPLIYDAVRKFAGAKIDMELPLLLKDCLVKYQEVLDPALPKINPSCHKLNLLENAKCDEAIALFKLCNPEKQKLLGVNLSSLFHEGHFPEEAALNKVYEAVKRNENVSWFFDDLLAYATAQKYTIESSDFSETAKKHNSLLNKIVKATKNVDFATNLKLKYDLKLFEVEDNLLKNIHLLKKHSCSFIDTTNESSRLLDLSACILYNLKTKKRLHSAALNAFYNYSFLKAADIPGKLEEIKKSSSNLVVENIDFESIFKYAFLSSCKKDGRLHRKSMFSKGPSLFELNSRVVKKYDCIASLIKEAITDVNNFLRKNNLKGFSNMTKAQEESMPLNVLEKTSRKELMKIISFKYASYWKRDQI